MKHFIDEGGANGTNKKNYLILLKVCTVYRGKRITHGLLLIKRLNVIQVNSPLLPKESFFSKIVYSHVKNALSF